MALISIGGVAMTTPSSYEWSIMDISNAERNAKGNLIIERINTKRKLVLSWDYLTGSQLATLLQAVQGTSANKWAFSVTYLDAQTNSYLTKTMYVGDRSIGMLDFQNGVPRYKDIKFDLIEV